MALDMRSGRAAVAIALAAAMLAAASCGGKPAYCDNRSNLENSIKDLPSATASGGVSGLSAQLTKIKSDATTLVSSAKSDFPTESSAVKSSIDTLDGAIKALPSSPSTSDIAAIAADTAKVVSSVRNFADASKSKCS